MIDNDKLSRAFRRFQLQAQLPERRLERGEHCGRVQPWRTFLTRLRRRRIAGNIQMQIEHAGNPGLIDYVPVENSREASRKVRDRCTVDVNAVIPR